MKYTVEMVYGITVSVTVEANTKEEAIYKAKDLMEENKSEYADVEDLEFEEVCYVSNGK